MSSFRLVDVELITVSEGEESNDFWNLAGDKKLYNSLASGELRGLERRRWEVEGGNEESESGSERG